MELGPNETCPGRELAFPKPFSYGACTKSMEVYREKKGSESETSRQSRQMSGYK